MQASVAGRQLIMVLLDASGSEQRVGDAQRLRRWAEASLVSAGRPDFELPADLRALQEPT